jgi:hypothetical protein
MAQCEECGRHENLPYQCRRCGGTFCAEHRLPENHDCPGLDDWNDPSGVFDSGFDDSVDDVGGSRSGYLDRLTGTGGFLGYFRGNVAYLFLALMWVTFLGQIVLGPVLGQYRLAQALFVLESSHPEYVWTWFTSIFAHGGIYHIAGNSIVLYFFGPLVERYVGSKRFALLFLVSGVAAGLGFVGISLLLNPGSVVSVVGASGAIFAVLGVLTVLNPGLKIYLYFILPIPLWLFTIGFALISILFFLSPGAATSFGMGNVAHLAHLIGLVIGLVYGERIKGQRQVPNRLSFGGPGGPGRRR